MSGNNWFNLAVYCIIFYSAETGLKIGDTSPPPPSLPPSLLPLSFLPPLSLLLSFLAYAHSHTHTHTQTQTHVRTYLSSTLGAIVFNAENTTAKAPLVVPYRTASRTDMRCCERLWTKISGSWVMEWNLGGVRYSYERDMKMLCVWC
jgi:hypothetical protein